MIATRSSYCTRFIAGFAVICGFAGGCLALAADQEASRQKLDALRAKMHNIGAELQRDSGERDRVRTQLEELERDIARLNRELSGTQRAALAKRESVVELTARYREHAAKLARQQQELAQLANTKYRMGKQDFVKMFLNQEDPARLGRALAYYRYVARARSARIDAISAALRETEDLKAQVQEQHRELNALQEDQQRQQKSLTERHAQRRALLASIEQRIDTHRTALKHLKRDEARLERLVEQVRAAVRDVPADLPAGTSFQQMRGRLALPVDAEILAKFGEPKSRAGRWRGLFLGAREGQEVRAVFHGRVAFADWLRGFGLLLILDHGSGYMSLYSHNQDLHKQVGDWVATGELISRAGTSGGLRSSGLYFEIRHNGEPQNPLLWCTVTSTFATGGRN